jgi:GWxTD domain-containing protein
VRKNIVLFAIFSIVIYSLSGCFTAITTTSTNANKSKSGSTYNPFIYRLHPEFFLYNTGSGASRLYVKLNLVELMFAPIGPNRTYQGKVKFDYFIYKPDELRNVVDSSSITYEIKKRKGQTNAVTYINVNSNGLKEYYLRIKTTDALRGASVEEYLYINVNEKSSGQNFIVNLKKNNVPFFRNYFKGTQTYSIRHNEPQDSLFIKYYSTDVPLPAPPFSSLQRSPINTIQDSLWSLGGNESFLFNEKMEGRYFLQTDTTETTGLCLLNHGEDYPTIKSSEAMLYPLQYLTSTAEFADFLNSTNKKLAIDRFWLKCGGNLNRARELIRIYYNRTLYANIYFTSFTEGWRTDRGMIYLMFGPPKSVRKSPEKETWIYSDRLNYRMLQFVFNRSKNPFSTNDFVLERNLDFKPFWFKSVESWRSGKVYTVFN